MDDIEKSRHGRYEDNAKNRRLHRVGQEYGSKKQEDETVDPSKLTLDQLHKEINELGHILDVQKMWKSVFLICLNMLPIRYWKAP